jgi:transposase-like protein
MKSGAKLPTKDVILFVIKEVMQKHKEIDSLKEFTDLVNFRLKMVDSKLCISGQRLKVIFVKIPGTKIVVETRKGKTKDRCPSCSSSLKKVYLKNLKGKKILYKLVCHRCGYSGANGKFSPKRYRFLKV